MVFLKSKLEIEVSDYKFPILISEIEGNIGQYSIEEYSNKEEEKEEKINSVISAVEESFDTEDTRVLLSWLYSNRLCEFDEVLRDEDCYGLHISGDSSKNEIADEVFNFIENDTEIYHRIFEKFINGERHENLVGGSVDNWNKVKSFRLALEILKHIDENLNI